MDKKPPLTPQQADKLLCADVANIIKRVGEGKALTREQRALVMKWTSDEDSETEQSTVTTWVALADALGVSRRSLTNWRKRKGAPKPASNGQHSVTEWRLFLRSQGLIENADGSSEHDPEEMEELKRKRLKVDIEKREHELAIQRSEYLHKDDVREAVTALVADALKLLRNRFENELPPICAGLDAVRIRKENSRVIDETCEILNRGAVPG